MLVNYVSFATSHTERMESLINFSNVRRYDMKNKYLIFSQDCEVTRVCLMMSHQMITERLREAINQHFYSWTEKKEKNGKWSHFLIASKQFSSRQSYKFFHFYCQLFKRRSLTLCIEAIVLLSFASETYIYIVVEDFRTFYFSYKDASRSYLDI